MKAFIGVMKMLFIISISVVIVVFVLVKALNILSSTDLFIKTFSLVGEFSIRLYFFVTIVACIGLFLYFTVFKKK